MSQTAGQSSIEAAVLIPVLMLLVGLLAQPVCMAYTQCVMRHAAAESLRVAMTNENDSEVRAFALRRLQAVPAASPFHVGGQRDWDIQIERGGANGATRMRIRGHLRPLPLLGAVSTMACKRDEVGVVLAQEVSETSRSTWLEGDYESWMSCWPGA